jgi:hypothetical protein
MNWNGACRVCVVISEPNWGGNDVLQRMWSGYCARAGLLSTVWPPGNDDGSSRARPSISGGNLRGQGEGAVCFLVHLRGLVSASGVRWAGLRERVSLRAFRPVGTWPLDAWSSAGVVWSGDLALCLVVRGGAGRAGSGGWMGPDGAHSVGTNRGHCCGFPEPLEVSIRDGIGYLDPGRFDGLSEYDTLRAVVGQLLAFSFRLLTVAQFIRTALTSVKCSQWLWRC